MTAFVRNRLAPSWLAIILVGYMVLAVIYSVVTPIFEPPDEVFHFPLIDHIADTGRLPVQDPAIETLWHQEGSQPPLYYVLSASLVKLIDRSDLEARQERNPHARIGVGLATDNQAIVLHDWEAESFPWQKTTLAVHIIRFFSILLGAGTITCISFLARLAVPERPAIHLAATLLAAFNPMFLFISASVNNDNLINLLSAAALVALLRLWHYGYSTRKLIALAILMALASISKLSGLALYPTAGLVVLLLHARDRLGWRSLLKAGVLTVVIWLVIAGWWYWRNIVLYGEPTGMERMIAIIGPRETAPSWSDLLDELEGLRLSFWGVFGMLNVIALDSLFDYGNALVLAALTGWLVVSLRTLAKPRTPQSHTSSRPTPADWITRQRSRLAVAFLLLHVLIVFAALVNWTRRTPATQGRLLFPVLGPLAILAVLGIAHLIPRRSWQKVIPITAVPLTVFAVMLPFTTIRPAYQPPPTVASITADAIPVDAQFGPIELLGVQVGDANIEPGNEHHGLRITLYWRPRAHTAEDMSLYVQVLGLPDATSEVGLQEIGKLDTYPGGGLLRTTTWELNRIYADSYQIPIIADALTPVRPKLKIGWRQFETGEEFEPATRTGQPRAPVVVEAGRIAGKSHHLDVATPLDAIFSNALRLSGSKFDRTVALAGESVAVMLEWQALTRVHEDFTILVHLLNSNAPGQPLAQADSPPLNGRWPTSAWEPGHAFIDTHTISLPPDLPPGQYRVAIGFYHPADFSRLPVATKHDTLPGALLLPQVITVQE